MASHLFIVAWDRPDLWDYWKRWFADVDNIEVILDRRRRDRRVLAEPREPERRQEDRRQKPEIDEELRTVGFAIVSR